MPGICFGKICLLLLHVKPSLRQMPSLKYQLVSPKYLLVRCLQLIYLVGPADPILCYRNKEPHLQPSKLVNCTTSVLGCHEYAYAPSYATHVTYGSGCGVQVPETVERSSSWMAVHNVKLCHRQDGCNDQLKQELLRDNRICFQAFNSRKLGGRAIACKPDETKCYFEKANSPVPFYNAGCGTCPGHTMSCFTCEQNFCNSTSDPTAMKDDKAMFDDPSLDGISLVAEAAAEALENAGAATAVAASAVGVSLLAAFLVIGHLPCTCCRLQIASILYS